MGLSGQGLAQTRKGQGDSRTRLSLPSGMLPAFLQKHLAWRKRCPLWSLIIGGKVRSQRWGSVSHGQECPLGQLSHSRRPHGTRLPFLTLQLGATARPHHLGDTMNFVLLNQII